MHSHPRIAELLELLNNPSLPGIDLSLERVWLLLKALGEPQKKIPPVIHLAGTNGKGSTQAFLRAIYQSAGYRVHAYISPHLVRFNERIVVAGSEVSDDYLLELLERVQAASRSIPVTFFEATTAAAFLAFAEHSADLLILETGMGGRLDATNVVDKPLASVLTPIDYDHMEFLGSTLTEIAGEKAGIMKRGVPCFVGEQVPEAREVIKRAARRLNSPLILHGRDWSYETLDSGVAVHVGAQMYALPKPALAGAHQYHNAALAVTVAASLMKLPVAPESLAEGIARAVWPARLQRLTYGDLVTAWGGRGEVYLDGGHNAHAAAQLAEWIQSRGEPITLVLGMMARKDARAFLRPIAPYIASCVTVPVEGGECYPPATIATIAQTLGIGSASSAPNGLAEAAQMVKTGAAGTLLIAGSLFLAGEVLKNHG